MHRSKFTKHPLSLMVSASLALLPAASVLAPALLASASANAQTPANVVIRYDIPAGSLTKALNLLGQQSGLVLMYSPSLTEGLSTPGLTGSMTVEQALDSLLASTELVYTINGNRVTLIENNVDGDDIALPPITVTGERVKRSLRETASSVEVMDAASIERHTSITSGNDLNALISNQVGNETTNYAPAVRGLDGTGPARGAIAFFAGTRSRLGLIIDGRPAGFNELVFADSSMWDVEQVEVYRGPQSTLNGRNSIAGAMVMKTKDPSFTPEGAARVAFGNNNSRQYAAAVSAPINSDWAFRVAGEYKARDSFIDFEGYEADENPGEFRSNNVRAKLLYQPDANPDLTNLITVSYQDYHGPQGEQLVYPFSDHQPDSAQTATFSPKSTNASMETVVPLNSDWQLENTLSWSDFNINRTVPTAGRGNVDIDGSEYLLEPRLRYTGSQTISGFVGLYLFNSSQDEDIDLWASLYDDSTRTTAIFGESQIQLSQALQLTLGGRYEREHRQREGGGSFAASNVDLDETYSAFMPKLGLGYQLSTSTTVGLQVSKGFNGGGAGVTFADPYTSYEYDPETVWNYEAYLRSSLLNNHLAINANAFYADYTDMQLPYQLASESIVIRNAESVQTYGLETGVQWLPVDHISVSGDIGLLQTDISKYPDSGYQGNELPRSPDLTSSLAVNYSDDDIELGLNARYTSAYYVDIDNTERVKTSAFWVANAEAAWKYNNLRLFGYIKNLFDADDVTYYRTVGATQADDVAYIVQPRNAGVGVDMKF